MPEKSTNSNEKIHEALELLNEAAKEKGGEIQNLIVNKYKNLKDSVLGTDVKGTIDSAKKNASEAANRAKEISEEKVKEIATQVDQNVHSNPWPYIGGVAVVSLLMGFILGRKD